MRRYDEPIEVLFSDCPRRFIWRGRLLLVKQVQTRWSLSADWWDSPTVAAVRGEGDDAPEGQPLVPEWEVWRVEAGNGAHRGVYEIAHLVGSVDWTLRAVCD